MRLGPESGEANVRVESIELDLDGDIAAGGVYIDTGDGGAGRRDAEIADDAVPIGLGVLGFGMGDVAHEGVIPNDRFTNRFEAGIVDHHDDLVRPRLELANEHAHGG